MKQKNNKESKNFWLLAEKVAKEVERWPEWKYKNIYSTYNNLKIEKSGKGNK